jgi:hypothetical protein
MPSSTQALMISLRRSLSPLLIVIALGMLMAAPARATTVVPPEFADLAGKSDYIVRGRVTALHSEIQIRGNSRRIFTSVEVEVLETIAGTPPAKMVLQCLGGRVGDEEMIVDGAPVFKVGEESVLFVSGNGRALSPLYAMNYGFYPVREEVATKRRYVARGNEVPLADVAEVAQPLLEGPEAAAQRLKKSTAQALSPEEFSRKIKAMVSRNPARESLN